VIDVESSYAKNWACEVFRSASITWRCCPDYGLFRVRLRYDTRMILDG
jgi:hypothetical protein